jgi:hypothetical protein
MDQVTSLCRSLGLKPGPELSRIAQRLAFRLGSDAADGEKARELLADWFSRTLQLDACSRERALAVGRAALLLSGMLEKRPDLILVDELPAEWLRRLEASVLRPAPAPSWGEVVEQILEPAPPFELVQRLLVVNADPGPDSAV